jgi:hypothetical protein
LAINYTFNDNAIRRGATLCNRKNFLLRTIPTVDGSSPGAHELISGIYFTTGAFPGEIALAVSILAGAAVLASYIFARVFLHFTTGAFPGGIALAVSILADAAVLASYVFARVFLHFTTGAFPGGIALAVSILADAAVLASYVFARVFLTATNCHGAKEHHR